MANTYVAIAKNVLTSTTAFVTFSSIPQTYTDLLLVATGRNTDGGVYTEFTVQFNGDTGNNYSHLYLLGNGASVATASSTSTSYYASPRTVNGGSSTASTFCNIEMYMPNYKSTTTKPVCSNAVQESNDTTANYANINSVSGYYSGTSAISSIKIGAYYDFSTVSFVSGSSFYLYGIKSS